MNKKFIKKSLLFVVKQPGAGRLEFYWPNASIFVYFSLYYDVAIIYKLWEASVKRPL